MNSIGYAIHTWRSLWSPDYIWEAEDAKYMRVVKTIFYGVTFLLLGWWLVLLRDTCVYFGWKRAVAVCNSVPNVITVAIRGVAGTFAVIFLFLATWRSETFWLFGAVGWFWVMVGMFCTDFLDGPLARQLDHVTVFGHEADPTVDKIISALLVLAMITLVFEFQGIIVALVLSGAMGWLIWVERDVVIITFRARGWSKKTGIKMHGAFGPGKVKFVLESVALGFGFGWLVWAPTSLVGTVITIGVLIPARYFADKSRGRHREEEHALHKEYARGVRPTELEIKQAA